jgi:cysteine-rich repeat protein
LTTRAYYTCSDICLQQPINLCGDTFESNGPYDQWDASNNPKDDREECDDGNNIDGDGCSSTCKVEHTWECMDDPGNDLWGYNSCRPKCGNGIVDPPYLDTDGVTWFTEQCDLGIYNSDGDVYSNACSTTCQKKGITN